MKALCTQSFNPHRLSYESRNNFRLVINLHQSVSSITINQCTSCMCENVEMKKCYFLREYLKARLAVPSNVFNIVLPKLRLIWFVNFWNSLKMKALCTQSFNPHRLSYESSYNFRMVINLHQSISSITINHASRMCKYEKILHFTRISKKTSSNA